MRSRGSYHVARIRDLTRNLSWAYHDKHWYDGFGSQNITMVLNKSPIQYRRCFSGKNELQIVSGSIRPRSEGLNVLCNHPMSAPNILPMDLVGFVLHSQGSSFFTFVKLNIPLSV